MITILIAVIIILMILPWEFIHKKNKKMSSNNR